MTNIVSIPLASLCHPIAATSVASPGLERQRWFTSAILDTSWIKISFDFINNEKRKWSSLLWNSMMLMSLFFAVQDGFFSCHSGMLLDSTRIRPRNPACLLIRDLSGLKYFPRLQLRAQSPVSSQLHRTTWLSDSQGKATVSGGGEGSQQQDSRLPFGSQLSSSGQEPHDSK